MDHFDPSKGRVTLDSTNTLLNEEQGYGVHGVRSPSSVLKGNGNDGASPVSPFSHPSGQTPQPKIKQRGSPIRSRQRNSRQINIAGSGTGSSEENPKDLSKANNSEIDQSIASESVLRKGSKGEQQSSHSLWFEIYAESFRPSKPSSRSGQLQSLHVSTPAGKNGCGSPGSSTAEWSFPGGEQNPSNALPSLQHMSAHDQKFTMTEPRVMTGEHKASRIDQSGILCGTNAPGSTEEIAPADPLDQSAWSVSRIDCTSTGPRKESDGGKTSVISDKQESKSYVVSQYEKSFSNFTSGLNVVLTGLTVAKPSSLARIQFECTDQKGKKGYMHPSEFRHASPISSTTKQMSQNVVHLENKDRSHRAQSIDAQDTSNNITHVLRSTQPLENSNRNHSKDGNQHSSAGEKHVSHTVPHYKNNTNQGYRFDAHEPRSVTVKIPQYSGARLNNDQNSVNNELGDKQRYCYHSDNEDTSLWDRNQPENGDFVRPHQFDGAGPSSITGRSRQYRGGLQFNTHDTNMDIGSADSNNDHVTGFSSTDVRLNAGKRLPGQAIQINSGSSSQYYGFDEGSTNSVRGAKPHSKALQFDDNHKNPSVGSEDNKQSLDQSFSNLDLSLSVGKRPLVLNSLFESGSTNQCHRSNEGGPSSATGKQLQRGQRQFNSHCVSQHKKSNRLRFRFNEGTEEQTDNLDVHNEGRRHHNRLRSRRPKSGLRQDIYATNPSVSKGTDQDRDTSNHMENGKKVLRESGISSSKATERTSWSEIRAEFLRTAIKRPDFATVPDFVQELYQGKDHILEQLMPIIGVDQCIERFALANNLLTPDEVEHLTNTSNSYNYQADRTAGSSSETASYLVGARMRPENSIRMDDHVCSGSRGAQFRTNHEAQVSHDQDKEYENESLGHTQETTKPLVSGVAPSNSRTVAKEKFSWFFEDFVGNTELPSLTPDDVFSPMYIDELFLNAPVPEPDERQTASSNK